MPERMPKNQNFSTSLEVRRWTRTKNRVRGAVKQIAGDLVKLYAQREQQNGYAFGEDTVWQREFEELFPFDETEDQILAIEATKTDMQSHKIMDRLICGDVGYGKTEVAIRAAFQGGAGQQASGISCSDNHSGTADLRYVFAEDEGFSGECGFDVPFQKRSRAEKDDRKA